MGTRVGWQALGEWSVGFGLLTLSAIGVMSIGILILPFAIGALRLAGKRNRIWPEAAPGAFVGIGSVCVFIAYLHRSDSPCSASGGTIWVRPGDFGSCGGLDPMPWLKVGVALTVSGLLAYAVLQRTGLGRANT